MSVGILRNFLTSSSPFLKWTWPLLLFLVIIFPWNPSLKQLAGVSYRGCSCAGSYQVARQWVWPAGSCASVTGSSVAPDVGSDSLFLATWHPWWTLGLWLLEGQNCCTWLFTFQQKQAWNFTRATGLCHEGVVHMEREGELLCWGEAGRSPGMWGQWTITGS